MLKNTAIRLIKKVFPEIDSTSTAYSQALVDIINHRNLIPTSEPQNGVTIIVFSKDRAIQLHALLASFFKLVKGKAELKVLYTASTPEHKVAYQKLESIFANRGVAFTFESDFREDLIRLLDQVRASKLMFLVDDIVFKAPLDLDELTAHNTNLFVPTLRMGSHLTYCYPRKVEMPLPSFLNGIVDDPDKMVWRWRDGKVDWTYPLSVDGHLFDANEMRIIIESLQFKAPNSLEESMQLFNPIYQKRYGLAFKDSVILNIPINKVQQENDNHAGSLSTEYLLQKWLDDYQINYRKLLHFRNTSAHQEVELEFIKLEANN